MILELELAPEVASEVERQAQQNGQSVSEYVAATLREKITNGHKPRRVLSGYGKYAYLGRTVDDFLAERHAEADAELEKDDERARLRQERHESL